MKHENRRSVVATLLAATLVLGSLLGCQGRARTSDDDIVRVEFAAVRTMVTTIKAEDQAILVDPRPANHRRASTIQGSLHIPIQDMRANDPRLAQAGRIVVFGSDWTDDLSSAAAKRLIALGYGRVFDYRGGVADWQKNGGSVVTIETTP